MVSPVCVLFLKCLTALWLSGNCLIDLADLNIYRETAALSRPFGGQAYSSHIDVHMESLKSFTSLRPTIFLSFFTCTLVLTSVLPHAECHICLLFSTHPPTTPSLENSSIFSPSSSEDFVGTQKFERWGGGTEATALTSGLCCQINHSARFLHTPTKHAGSTATC